MCVSVCAHVCGRILQLKYPPRIISHTEKKFRFIIYQDISSLKGTFPPCISAQLLISMALLNWGIQSQILSNHAWSSWAGEADVCWGALCGFTSPFNMHLAQMVSRLSPFCTSLLSSRADQNLVRAGLKGQGLEMFI